jgi:hypothetical protein
MGAVGHGAVGQDTAVPVLSGAVGHAPVPFQVQGAVLLPSW